MLARDLKPGDPLHWRIEDPDTKEMFTYYAVVVNGGEGSIECALVYDLDANTKCFDEGGSKRDTDEHNVRLKHAPPPFKDLAEKDGARGVYVYADMSDLLELDDEIMALLDIDMPDGGYPVHEEDMAYIRDHPWRDEKAVDFFRPEDLDDGFDETMGSLLDKIAEVENAGINASWRDWGCNSGADRNAESKEQAPVPASVRKVFELAGRDMPGHDAGKDMELG